MVWQAMSDNGDPSFAYSASPYAAAPKGSPNLYVQVMGNPRHLTFRHISLLAPQPAVAPGREQPEPPPPPPPAPTPEAPPPPRQTRDEAWRDRSSS
jgi:hypothetical protein